MKPVPIAGYLDHIGRVPGEKPSPRREASPFRPRSLQNVHAPEPRALPAFDRAPAPPPPPKPQPDPRSRRLPWDREPPPSEVSPRDSLMARETAKAQEMALRLAEAHARGREEGFAEGRAEAEELVEAERAASREQALVERLEFQLNEYAELEGSIRAGFQRVEENVGAAVVRILAPFLVKEVVKYVADDLAKTIARLCAGGAPGLITIRGPERVLDLLRDRIGAMPVEFAFVDQAGVEAVVECGATQIATELRPWSELLTSLDAEDGR
jgi:flagellar biosynthesis/type III secretory pathway protein FliH